MQILVTNQVPVRMGIGRGTFHAEHFSHTNIGKSLITQALFFGTAIVRAHAAEQCGGKGMRVFLHPLVEPDLSLIQKRVPLLDLPRPSKAAQRELKRFSDRPCTESGRMVPLSACGGGTDAGVFDGSARAGASR